MVGLFARACRVCADPFTTNDGRLVFCSLDCRREGRRAHDRKNQSLHRKHYAIRVLCRQTLRNAVDAGAVRRPYRCEACGKVRAVEAHHSDYELPFFVEWLCKTCHEARADSAA